MGGGVWHRTEHPPDPPDSPLWGAASPQPMVREVVMPSPCWVSAGGVCVAGFIPTGNNTSLVWGFVCPIKEVPQGLLLSQSKRDREERWQLAPAGKTVALSWEGGMKKPSLNHECNQISWLFREGMWDLRRVLGRVLPNCWHCREASDACLSPRSLTVLQLFPPPCTPGCESNRGSWIWLMPDIRVPEH